MAEMWIGEFKRGRTSRDDAERLGMRAKTLPL